MDWCSSLLLNCNLVGPLLPSPASDLVLELIYLLLPRLFDLVDVNDEKCLLDPLHLGDLLTNTGNKLLQVRLSHVGLEIIFNW
jgi:hypothetical protein